MKQSKKCERCKKSFEGESWQPYCVKCYKAIKAKERLDAQRREGAKVVAAIEARRSEVRKAKRRLKVTLPDKNRQEEE